MKDWDRGALHVSENGRYLMEGDKPFFWLGDTAWLLFHKLEQEEICQYLRNRKEKGFNVIQATLIHMLPDRPEMGGFGKSPLEPAYWEHVDKALDQAESVGLYVGLLPIWGAFVKRGLITLDNIDTYAQFLGKRFQHRPNLIWILGGDIRGDVAPEVYRREAEILKAYNPDRLMTFHPFGRTSSSLWFHDEPWLDFNLFQSGHRRYDQQRLGEWDDNNQQREPYYGEDNWRYVDRDHSHATMKPTIDGEPSYEGIRQGLHKPKNPYWEEWDVRRYAYWSVFEGAAGHTYGNNAIMQFYMGSHEFADYGVREPWQEALHYPGSGQMQYLKQLMESVDFVQGKPMDSMLLYGQKERYHRVSVFAGPDYAFAYTYSGDEFLLDLRAYQDMALDVWWMDPRNGAMSYIETIRNTEKWLASPFPRKGISNDWVLVLKRAEP